MSGGSAHPRPCSESSKKGCSNGPLFEDEIQYPAHRLTVMLYAVLCYGCEDELASLDVREERAMIQRCVDATNSLPRRVGRGPALRLMPTSTAITMRSGNRGFERVQTLDGPSTVGREQLLGMWLFECNSLDDAMASAQRIAQARGIIGGALEVRPVAHFCPAEREAELTLT